MDARVQVEGRPSERWLEAITRACEQLAAMPDRDPTASARLTPSGDDILVEVVLNDGRSAIRRVKTPLALQSTLEALVTLPPTNKPREPEPPLPSSPAETPPTELQAKPAPGHERPPTVEIGLGVAGRIARAEYASLAPTAEANLLAGKWLFGLWARWDVVSWQDVGSPAGFEMETVGAGLGVARRFDLRALDLDVGFSPRLLAETQSYEANGKEQTLTASDVRAASFVRATFGRSALRFAATLDGEVSPGRLRRDIHLEPDLPALPSWSVGLAFGLSWTAP